MYEEPTYHEHDSYTLGERWVLAAGREHIAFGRVDGQVDLCNEDGCETLALATPLDDLDLHQYLLALSGDTVHAYTMSGVELWTQEVPDATAVAALGARGVVAVPTDGTDVIGLDIETGSRIFTANRRHPDLEPEHIVSGDGVLAIGTWSFVVCFDTTGEVTLDWNFGGTIEAAGVVDGRVVVVRQDGTVAALDPATGDQCWSTSSSIRHLAPRGSTWLPALDDAGPGLIHVDGHVEQLDVERGSHRIVGSRDGTVLGIADETLAYLYRSQAPPSAVLEANLLTDSVATGEPIRARIENTGDRQVTTTVTLDIPETVSVATRYKPIDLQPGEASEVAYRLQNTPPEQIACGLLVDSRELTRQSVTVERRLDLEAALDVRTECASVTDGRVTVRATVENTSEATLDEIQIGDRRAHTVPPGETVATEHNVALGTQCDITTTAVHGETSEAVETALPVPERALAVDTDRRDEPPSIDIALTPAVEVPVSGNVTVDIGDTTFTREVSLSVEDRLVLVVVPSEPVTARDEVDLIVTSSLLPEPHRTTVQGWMDNQVTDALAGHRSSTGRGAPNAPDRDGPRMEPTVERTVPEAVGRGRVFTEQLKVTNEGNTPLEGCQVVSRDGEYTIECLGPAETMVLQRHHALYKTGEQQLPPVQVGRTDTTTRTVDVDRQDIEIAAVLLADRQPDETITADGGDGRTVTTRVDVTNRSTERCAIDAFEIDFTPEGTERVWELDDPQTVPAGETKRLTRTALLPETELYSPQVCLVGVRRHHRDEESLHTLAPIRTERDAANAAAAELAVELRDHTEVVTGTTGTVSLDIINRAGEEVSDLAVAVEGELVHETPLFDGSVTIPSLPPGTDELVKVDVRPETAGTATLTVTLRGSVGGQELHEVVSVTGPVAETTADWSRGADPEDWTVEDRSTADDGLASPGTGTEHLVTPFLPREGGNHR